MSTCTHVWGKTRMYIHTLQDIFTGPGPSENVTRGKVLDLFS